MSAGWLGQDFLSWTGDLSLVTGFTGGYKKMDPTQRSYEATYQPDEAFPLSATCQERSRNVVAIGYAAARWAGRLKVTQMQLFVLPVTLFAALL